MEFVAKSDSLQAAVVRKVVFGQAKPGDQELIEAHFSDVFARQKPDGSLDDPHDQGLLAATGEELLGLLEMGCSPGRPEMQRAIAAMRKAAEQLEGEKASDMSCYSLRALCLLGITEPPAVRASLRRIADEMEDMLGGGCPWTPFVQLNALWAGREVVEVDGAIERALTWAEEAVEPSGCSNRLRLCVPWSIVQMVGIVDRPAAERIARKIVPMLLRLQQPDGGWGEPEKNSTLRAFAVLSKYGLLEELRELPPLPPDWEVVRSIPLPGEKPQTIFCASGNLWVLDGATWSALAVSQTDGRVLKTVKLTRKPGMNHHGFASGDGKLYISAFGEKGKRSDMVYEVDAETGEVMREMPIPATNRATGNARVDGKLLVADGWEGGVWVIDLDRPEAEPARTWLAAGMPDYMASHGDEIWCVDWFAPVLVRTNIEGELLDWGERPFGFAPVAWDGEHLWALDPENSRICVIRKADYESVIQEADHRSVIRKADYESVIQEADHRSVIEKANH
jgi:hypothetical protein